ncbi:MAG: amidohydrolase family protein [Nitrososphaerales archaeon]
MSSKPGQKYRGLKAGLDNAIRQAEDRGLHDMLIIDADCHQMEPFTDFAKYFDEPYRSMILAKDPEVDPWLAQFISSELPFTGSGQKRPSQFAMKGIKFLQRPETSYPKYQRANDLINLFTNVMHDIGIKRSVIFPTAMLSVSAQADSEFEARVARAYMDYMLDNFLGKYPEILSPIYIPTNDSTKAAELIDDVGSEKGIVCIMISGGSKKLAGSDELDPVYEAAENKGLPVCIHGHYVGSQSMGLESMEFIGIHSLGFPLSVIRNLVSLVLNGVPVRYPKLRFAFVEGGVTWIPWIMNRLDDEYTKRKLEAPLLTKMPSEYMKEFYYSSQPLEQAHKEELEHVFSLIDAENHLMFASDYPHWDFDVPSVIYDLPFLSDTAKKKILGENASKFFRLN